jgi:hypothetical protein
MNEQETKPLIKELFDKLDSIEKRLFRDNGTISIQTRLYRHEQVIRGVLWALSVIGGAFLTTLVAVSVLAIKAWMALG